MEAVKNCRECGNTERCLELIRNGTVVYCGGSMCRPTEKN